MLPRSFRNVAYTRIFCAALLSQLGSYMTFVAVPLIAWHATHSGATFGMISFAGAVGRLAALPLGGVLADRFDRRRLLALGDLVSIAALGVIFVAARGDMWFLLGLAQFVDSACGGLVDSAMPALRRDAMAVADRAQGNALFMLTQWSGAIIGPPLGTLLYATAGFGSVVAIDAATFVAAIVLVLGVRGVRTRAEHPVASAATPRESLRARTFGDLAAGLRVALSDPAIAFAPLMYFGAGAADGFLVIAAIPWFTHTMHAGDAAFGTMMAIIACAGIGGSFTTAALGERFGTVGLLLIGASLDLVAAVGIVLHGSVPMLDGSMALIGIGAASGMVAVTTLTQARVPSHFQGRISSLYKFSAVLGGAIASGSAGFVVDHAGAPMALTFSGLCFAVSAGAIGAIGWTLWRAERREPALANV